MLILATLTQAPSMTPNSSTHVQFHTFATELHITDVLLMPSLLEVNQLLSLGALLLPTQLLET
jgi:hypothetical protein